MGIRNPLINRPGPVRPGTSLPNEMEYVARFIFSLLAETSVPVSAVVLAIDGIGLNSKQVESVREHLQDLRDQATTATQRHLINSIMRELDQPLAAPHHTKL